MIPPVALSIAGSDPSGGAGIQADLKTFSALRAYGACVITALTAQNTTGVYGVHEVPAPFVAEQLRVLADDIRLNAVKIGMLANTSIIETVTAFLRNVSPEIVVLDPVMVATSGDLLLREDAVHAMRELLPLASMVTPNVPEAAALLGLPQAATVDELADQASELLKLGVPRVLAKGGHLNTESEVIDMLADSTGVMLIRGPRIHTTNTHGTGCTLSSAVAALRPQRSSWHEAVRDSRAWLNAALTAANELEIGRRHGPVHHFTQLWEKP